MLDLNEVGEIDTYIDGADETNHRRQLIKGGGAALTREKIIAAAARRFICIADEAKLVDTLGAFPLPVEVIPMARSYVSRELARLGGRPVWRERSSPTTAITFSTCMACASPTRWRSRAPSIRSSAWSPWVVRGASRGPRDPRRANRDSTLLGLGSVERAATEMRGCAPQTSYLEEST